MVGTDFESVLKETKLLLDNKEEYVKMSQASNPYGDGEASRRICENIEYYFGLTEKKPEFFKYNH